MALGSKKAIYAALVGNALVAVTKFIAAAVTGSSAMLSEGIHSLVDTGNQVLLLWGDRQSRKPADEQFSFGHGREIYFWSFIVAILIFALGAGFSIYEGIHHLLHPQPVKNPMVNYLVLGLAIVFEGGSLWVAIRVFKHAKGSRGYFAAVHHGKDPSLFVVLFEDAAAMAGLLMAYIGIALGQVSGNPAFDGIAAILIGVILGGTAIWLAYETKSLLIGESANPEIVRTMRKYCLELPPVVAVNEVLTMHMGPEFILVNVSVDIADKATAGQIEKQSPRSINGSKRRFRL
jgi:cation diffusion facilitator family transporter